MPRTIRDIIEGRAAGVYGKVHFMAPGPVVDDRYPTLLLGIHEVVGVPLCGCGGAPAHTSILLSLAPCRGVSIGEDLARVVKACMEGEVEIAGDLVFEAKDVEISGGEAAQVPPCISGFAWASPVSHDTWVPSRGRDLGEECEGTGLLN